jgi:exopolyphosphatase/guanosine-5'-triphosphate,3'-diphosphate pyrophosphatase
MDNESLRVAAVDCGTNSTRLIVAGSGGDLLEREMRITRLGQEVDATHRLSNRAIARTVAVLEDYRRLMDEHGVSRVRVVATSAARDAENAEDFMAAAERVIGVRPEVLTGSEEGRLSFLGATAHLPPMVSVSEPLLVTDIGGGSTELSIGRPVTSGVSRPDVATRSLDIGCVRVSERFLRHDPPRGDEMEEARKYVESEIVRARDELPPLAPDGTLIGLAGTVSTLASLELGLDTYDRQKIHHATVTRDTVGAWLERLAGRAAVDRMAYAGMVEGRQDVIVGGVLILAVVMAAFGCARCLVSEDDILDGLAAVLLGRSAPVAAEG